jgi:hypothetical protein
MFLDHERLAASEFYVAYLIQHAIYLIPECAIFFGPGSLPQHLIMETAFTECRIWNMCEFFGGECGTAPGSTDPALEIADIAQFEIQEHQRTSMMGPWLIGYHVFESV